MEGKTFEKFAIASFEKINESLIRLERGQQETREIVDYLVQNTVTKTDLDEILDTKLNDKFAGFRKEIREEIRQSEQRVMDHTTRESAKVRGDLVALVRKEDTKVDGVVDALGEAEIFTSEKQQELKTYGPFPTAPVGN